MNEEKTENKMSIKIPKLNLWMILTIVFAIVLIVSLIQGWSITGKAVKTRASENQELSASEAGQKAVEYINKNIVQPGTSVSMVSSGDIGSVYRVVVSYQGNQIPIYITKDGSMLFLSGFNTSQTQEQPEEEPEETPKTDKPTVDLFVMSFCPYGVQAENSMKPVVDLLGSKADIRVRFIANVQGDTVDKVQSLHGITEAQEDLRQLCIMKYYNQTTYWKYLMDINTNCYGKINTRDPAALDTCWKNVATKTGIDIAKIQTCSNSTDGLNLLKADEQLVDKYGVSGSPTLIINGMRYSGARTPEAFKQAICSAFTTQPEECSQTLSSSGGTASGGCG